MGEISSKIGITNSTGFDAIDSSAASSTENSRVAGLVRPVKIGHVWVLNNFKNLCERRKTGEAISSPAFFSGYCRSQQHKWRLVLYPRGDSEQNKNYVSLYLQLVSISGTDDANDLRNLAVKTAFSLSLINAAGEEANKLVNPLKQCFVKDRTLWGYSRFISLAELLAAGNRYFQGNAKCPRITIFCENRSSEPTDSVPPECNLLQLALNENFRKVSSDLEALLHNRQLSDVTIAVQEDGSQFHAHKAILAARSPVFAAMFEHEMREKAGNVITLEDIRSEILQEMLRFVYSGRVHDLEGTAAELLPAADRFALDDLKSTCEEVLYNGMNVANAVELLIYADLYNAKRLKCRIDAYVIENSKDVVETQGFKLAMDSHPQLIAKVFQKMVQMQ